MGVRADRNQELVIEAAIEKGKKLTVFLKNGVPMKGVVLAHDPYTIFMQTEKNQALIFKHSITSMFPARLPRPSDTRRPGGGGGGFRPQGRGPGGGGHRPSGPRSGSHSGPPPSAGPSDN